MGSCDNQKSNGISKSGQFLLCTGNAAEEAGSKEKSQMIEGSWEGFMEKAALDPGMELTFPASSVLAGRFFIMNWEAQVCLGPICLFIYYFYCLGRLN